MRKNGLSRRKNPKYVKRNLNNILSLSVLVFASGSVPAVFSTVYRYNDKRFWRGGEGGGDGKTGKRAAGGLNFFYCNRESKGEVD